MASDNAATELKCNACGELNPKQFELCWNCGGGLQNAQRVAAADLGSDEADSTVPNEVPPKGIRWSDWFELAGVLLTNCAYPIIWYAFNDRNDSAGESISSVLATIPIHLGWLILLGMLIRRDRWMRQPAPLTFRRWYWEVLLALGIVAAEWIVSLVTAVLASDFRLPKGEPQIYVQVTNFKLATVYGITWAFAVAYEEVLFRAYLQSKLESLLGETILPILISAAIFAAGHGYPPRGTLHAFTFGVLFGVIYRMTSRLPRLVLAHWMWDMLRSFS